MTDNPQVINLLTLFRERPEQAHALWAALDDPSWLKRESGGDLSGINLWSTYLPGIDLSGCDLRNSNFYTATLNGANLSGANMENADLAYARLVGANLNGANLQRANLQSALFTGADVRGANMLKSNPWSAVSLPTYAQHDVNTLWADNFINLRAGPDEEGYYTGAFDKFHKWKDHMKRTGLYETVWPYHAKKKPEWIK